IIIKNKQTDQRTNGITISVVNYDGELASVNMNNAVIIDNEFEIERGFPIRLQQSFATGVSKVRFESNSSNNEQTFTSPVNISNPNLIFIDNDINGVYFAEGVDPLFNQQYK